MDLLQVALVLLIIILAIFLGITGFMVFLILKDLKKSMERLNEVLYQDDVALEKIRKSSKKLSASQKVIKPNFSPRRFFKKKP